MKHVIALSGGKDSTALALRLAEVEPREYIYLCTPTGDELPEMTEHWAKLELVLGQPILQIKLDGGLAGLIEKDNCLPNWRQRWCTSKLKIKPAIKWYEENSPCTVYVGLRADEEGRDGAYDTHIEQRFPLREWGWGLEDVLDYLDSKQIKIPRRTDCARCFFQTLGEWWNLWKIYPDVYQDSVEDEIKTGHTYRSPSRDTWPASLAELRKEFENGRVPRGANIQAEMDFGFSANKCRVCSL